MNQFTKFYLEKRAAPYSPKLWHMLAGGAANAGMANAVASTQGAHNPSDFVVPSLVGFGSGVLGVAKHQGFRQAGSSLREASLKSVPIAGAGLVAEPFITQGFLGAKKKVEGMGLDNQVKSLQVDALKNPTPAPAPVPASKPDFFGPPAPEVAAPSNPSSTTSQTDASFHLGLKEMIAAGALSAAGGYALYQIARANKRKADGLEAPPVTNVNVAGGGNPGATPDGKPAADSLGTLRVTLPTRGTKDHETQVEMPLERIGLSNSIIQKIKRDTKRRLRSEGSQRTHHIIPPLSGGLN